MRNLDGSFVRIFAASHAAQNPIDPDSLESLRVRADIEHQQHRESGNHHRALQLQVQQQAQEVM